MTKSTEENESAESDQKVTNFVIKNCRTKKSQKQMYLISDDGEQTFRSFLITNEYTNAEGMHTTYLNCVQCRLLRTKQALEGLAKT